MTQPTAPQQPQQGASQRDRQIIAGIAAILAAGVTAGVATSALVSLLAPLGIHPSAARAAYAVAQRGRPSRMSSGLVGPAQRVTQRAADTYRAAYVLVAARRLDDAVSAAGSDPAAQRSALATAIQREQRFAAQHVAAQANREASARAVDVASARVGKADASGTKMLGWYARMDDRTSAECRAANGRNFPADRPPLIGWPGAVHPHCRCKPGKPHANAGLVDDIGAREAA